MDLRSLNIEQEAKEKKYNPKFLLKLYVEYFKKLKLRFHLEPGEKKSYRKRFGALLAQNDKLQDAFDMAPELKEFIKLSEKQVKDIQRGKQLRKLERYHELLDEINKKSDYILSYKSDSETLRELVKAWWQISKKKLVKRTALTSNWFNFLTKAFSFVLARFIALGIKDNLVSFLSISSGKMWADIIASFLIFLLIDNRVEKVKAYFIWGRIKFMHERLLDLDSYLAQHFAELHAELEQN